MAVLLTGLEPQRSGQNIGPMTSVAMEDQGSIRLFQIKQVNHLCSGKILDGNHHCWFGMLAYSWKNMGAFFIS